MDQFHVLIILLIGAVASSPAHISGTELNLTLSLGDSATLYCDCKRSSGVYIVWYRNCSHVNQPTLVMKTRYPSEKLPLNREYKDDLHPFPRFHLVRNESSESYDLLITNISDWDEGLYYCGTEEVNTKSGGDKDKYIPTRYGNVTRRILTFESKHLVTAQRCDLCWTLLFSLCPASAVLSSLLSSCLVYHFCRRKTAKEPEVHEGGSNSSDRTRGNQDGDVCYAALEIRQATQRPKRKKTQSSDFSTYSDINTCRS